MSVPIWLRNAMRQVLAVETDSTKKQEIKADIKTLETEGKLPIADKTETTTAAPVAEAKPAVETPVVTPASAPAPEVKAEEVVKPAETVIAPVVEAKGIATQEAKIEKAKETIEKAKEEIKDIKKEEKEKMKAADATVAPAVEAPVVAPVVAPVSAVVAATDEEKNKIRKEKIAVIVAKSKIKQRVRTIAKKIESVKRLNVIKSRVEARKTAPAKKVDAKEELLKKLEVRKQIKESLNAKQGLLAKIEAKRKELEAKKKSMKNRYLSKAPAIKPMASDRRLEIMKKIKAKRAVDSIVSGMETKLGLKKK